MPAPQPPTRVAILAMPLDARFVAEIDWIRRCYAIGAAVATACSGALLLAGAGLLDGEEATTH